MCFHIFFHFTFSVGTVWQSTDSKPKLCQKKSSTNMKIDLIFGKLNWPMTWFLSYNTKGEFTNNERKSEQVLWTTKKNIIKEIHKTTFAYSNLACVDWLWDMWEPIVFHIIDNKLVFSCASVLPSPNWGYTVLLKVVFQVFRLKRPQITSYLAPAMRILSGEPCQNVYFTTRNAIGLFLG